MTWQTTPIATGVQPMAFTDSSLRWVWVTDSHVQALGDTKDVALKAAVNDCNVWRPNAFIHTGDIGDNSIDRVQRAFNNLKNCQRPLFGVIGNHDENEVVPGTPNTALLQSMDTFNRFPFYFTDVMTSGDGTLKARCLFLDCNIYNTNPSDPTVVNVSHVVGDRVGYSANEPAGGSYRKLGTAQLAWITSVLAADTTSNIILVFPHYPIAQIGVVPLDGKLVADALQADGRPAAIFGGHIHPDATSYTLTSTDTLKSYTNYKLTAMLESNSWCRVVLHLAAGAIVIDQLEIHNFTDPGGWTINAPFTSV